MKFLIAIALTAVSISSVAQEKVDTSSAPNLQAEIACVEKALDYRDKLLEGCWEGPIPYIADPVNNYPPLTQCVANSNFKFQAALKACDLNYHYPTSRSF